LPDIAINQVEYSNNPDGPIIFAFGRDINKVPHKIEILGFRPYFYSSANSAALLKSPKQASPDLDSKYVSILGEPLRRVYTEKPSDVRDVRERYQHFEADIPFATRFMIDLGITGGISVPHTTVDYHEVKPITIDAPARVSTIDIECDDSHGFPDAQHDAIICITCHDSFHDNYTTFLYSENGNEGKINGIAAAGGLKNGCFRNEFHDVFTFSDEPRMLRAFVKYIAMTDPDILTGWNFIQFDMPYILGRMDHFNIPQSSLARLSGFSAAGREANLRGRVLFDLLEAYKKMHQQQKQSYRLDAIAFDEVGEQKVRYTGTLTNLWRTDPAALVEYNFKDVELCVAIEKKNNIVDFFREIARYVGMPLDKTLNSSSVVDTYILHKAHGKFVLPSKGSAESEDFEGATVFEPTKGLHENIVVLDLKSLYPMIMMTINASPETKSPTGELTAPNGIRFNKSPDGLVRSIVMDLLKERDEKKALRNKYKFGSREYQMYDMQQNVLKIVMNTYYGVSGYSKFRLYDRDIGAAVTSVGRAILEHSKKQVESQGYKVVLGDTDSCAVKLPETMSREETISEAKRLEKLLNESYDDFARNVLHADHHYFSTKFEKLYARFFSGGKKKRYAGLLVWKEGKDVNEVDIVGFESRRSDTPQLTREVQQTIMGMILNGEDYSKIKTYMTGIIRSYRRGEYPLDEIGIPGGFSKALDDYETNDAHVRGAKYSNKHLHTAFGKASKPKRVYIKQINGQYPKTDVICFEYGDQVPSDFVVDWDLMLEKTLQKPIERIVEALDWRWNDFDPTKPSLSQWGMS
jgi:DNA polymerase I